VHNNFHFLSQFSKELNHLLVGKKLVECFSQLKDELVLGFASEKESTYLKTTISQNFAITTVVNEFHQAKRNVKHLFHELIGLEIKEVYQFSYERAFVILFKNSKYRLVFKLFGNRSNIILFRNDETKTLFRQSIKSDFAIIYNNLDRKLDLTLDCFIKLNGNLKKFIPTLGPLLTSYLTEQGFDTLELEKQHENLLSFLDFLQASQLYVNPASEKPQLSFFPSSEPLWQGDDTFEALKKLEYYYFNIFVFQQEKNTLIKIEDKKIKKIKRDLKKLQIKQNTLQYGQNKKELADVIMANLHVFNKNDIKTKLFNFYIDEEIEVEIKRGMSPQNYAGRLYKKWKNQHIELSHVTTNISTKEKDLETAQKVIIGINNIKGWRELRKSQPSKKQKEKVISTPNFKEFEFAGYKIYVGRNSKNNDELTLKFAKKEDLWLHAKDVPGSHVVIKKKSDQNIPKPVIEYAAILAGRYSKRKTDSLCPVTFTPKKYVRKIKGAPAGSVIIDREEVILVRLPLT
jgi:predicted ribosome quality control (RQC) complex YloA/Tae2 family protein